LSLQANNFTRFGSDPIAVSAFSRVCDAPAGRITSLAMLWRGIPQQYAG